MQRIGPKITLNMDPVLLARIDKIANHAGQTRADTMRLMLETCCEGYEPLMKVGLLRKMIENKQKIKNRIMKELQPDIA